MKNPHIVFTKQNTAELLDTPVSELSPNSVKVKTAVSTISAGTERANITGNTNVSVDTHEQAVAHFPRWSGYSSAGTVVEVGSNVKSVKVGDRVAMFWSSHMLYNVIGESNIVKIVDDTVSFEDAALCHIGNFPLAAIRKTRLEIGESMLIMGLGVLGLLGVIYARAAGAVPVIAADPIAERRKKALALGADYALDPTEDGFAEKVKELTSGGARTAIEVTGIGAGLNECLDCMARFGRVALLGCTRDKNFTVDYYRKVHGPGITLIGAHTNARPEHDSYPGFFTNRDDIKTQLLLLSHGHINFKNIVDETHSPAECAEVYDRLVSDKKFPPFVQFDWRRISE